MPSVSLVVAPRRVLAPRRAVLALGALALVFGLGNPGPARAGDAQDAVLPGMEEAVPSALAAKTLLLSASRIGTKIIAVGQWGHVVQSKDEGVTWTQARTVPTRETLTSVSFIDENNGWAVGHGATIIHTTDGGNTWSRQMFRPDLGGPLLSVHFISATTGFAAGAYGMFFETTDGGASWTQRTISDGDMHFNEFFAGPQGALYIAGEGGFGYKSIDSGKTWTKLETGYVGSFWAGLALDDGAILLAGMRGNIYRSTDGGKTFAPVETKTQKSLSGLTTLGDGSIVGVGLGGTLIRSTDGGQSFTAYTRPDRLVLSAVTEGPKGKILVLGEKGAQIEDLKVFQPGT